MINQTHSLPAELLRSTSFQSLPDGLYGTRFRRGEHESRGVLYKNGTHLYGGDDGVAYFGRMFGTGPSVTLHLEVHRKNDDPNPLFGTALQCVYELHGHASRTSVDLHGECMEGDGGILGLSLHFLRN